MTWGPAEEVVFLDTTTGPGGGAVDATIDWLRDWCDSHGWPFRVLTPPTSFDEIVATHGYPGPGNHGIMYIRLKERCIQQLAADVDADLHCWTGIRRWESDRRLAVADAEGSHADGRWYWHSPLVDWRAETVERYLDTFGLEPADCVRRVGRSCDCWCGSFGDRAELVDLAAAGYEEHAEWLDSLPTPDDVPRERTEWAGGNYDKSDWADLDDQQQSLCSECWRQKGGDPDA
jgi:3'-phosphoadenosine 5'-phosphosulfate sulfotransferase (PAPS reductase)/FAD synthetase